MNRYQIDFTILILLAIKTRLHIENNSKIEIQRHQAYYGINRITYVIVVCSNGNNDAVANKAT